MRPETLENCNRQVMRLLMLWNTELLHSYLHLVGHLYLVSLLGSAKALYYLRFYLLFI